MRDLDIIFDIIVDESPEVIERLKRGDRAEIWCDSFHNLGATVVVRQAFTHREGYEARIKTSLGRVVDSPGSMAWRFIAEPTGRVIDIEKLYNDKSKGEK